MRSFIYRNFKWIALKVAGLLVLVSLAVSPPTLFMKFLLLGAGLFLFGSLVAFMQERW